MSTASGFSEKSRVRRKPSLILPVLICIFCMVTFGGSPNFSLGTFRKHRTLLTLTAEHVNQYPFSNFLEVENNDPINQKKVVGFYWQIPRCGGTTLKHIMGTCLRRVQAARTSVDYCDTNTDEVQTCQTKVGTFVNSDPSDHGGIQRCDRMQLIQSNIPDVIVSSRILHAATLYDPDHKGRLFTIMRNPIERAVSTFYYLQNAYWERHYRPELKEMTILDYAALPDTANNWMTRWLTGKNAEPHLTRDDLTFAKELLRRKFFILLTDHMAVSLERLMYYMNWRIPEKHFNETHACLMANTGKSQGQNRNKHLMPDPGTPEYEALKAINDLDLELYEYATQLFAEQEAVIMKRMHKRTSELFIRQKVTKKKDAVGKASQSSEYEAAKAAAALMERPPENAGMDSMARNNLMAAALFLQAPNATAREKKDEKTMIASVMSKRQGSANKWSQSRAKVDVLQPKQSATAQGEHAQPDGAAAQTTVAKVEQPQFQASQASARALTNRQPAVGESQTTQQNSNPNSLPAEESRNLKHDAPQARLQGTSQQGGQASQGETPQQQ